MKISTHNFGTITSGECATLFHIENSSGAYIEITNYGARIVKIVVPSKTGKMMNVCLTLPSVKDYEKDTMNLGAICGRVAGRIKAGHFSLDGQEYQLTLNEGNNHLHGGLSGFANKMWSAQIKDDSLVLTMQSLDGEEGYPGNLTLQVTYMWSEDNELSLIYEAICDHNTLLNVTNHTYFTLNEESSILQQELFVDADAITEVDQEKIPTGILLPIDDTPFDFRIPHTIENYMNTDYPRYRQADIYGVNFALNGNGFRKVASLKSKDSGICMACYTDQPALQVFAPSPHTSICLETQHYPDAINHKHFPSIKLLAGETFYSKTIYHFSEL